ncbi:MAG: AmmeMemoRadiSam system radical SAM enzyme [bacterium]
MKEAMLYEKLDNKIVHCHLCSHGCKIKEGNFGICGVRQNINGVLNTFAYGYVIAANIDPIEKKPLYNFLPGSKSFSIATIGCNFKCDFCQNWQISQVDITSNGLLSSQGGEKMTPQELVQGAKKTGCQSISYTYTEPTIFFEYAYETAVLAKKEGLANVFVTNGFMTSEALEMICPYLDAANVDLKSFRDSYYSTVCKGRLEPVLETIRLMKKLGIWVELTTLLITGMNDSEEELRDIATFIRDVSVDIPWHISRFHPDFKLTDIESTPINVMRRAEEIGKNVGLRYVYLGNVYGEGNNTYCYNCGEELVQRQGFVVKKNIVVDSRCPRCKSKIGG